jgi:hypothetical protein
MQLRVSQSFFPAITAGVMASALDLFWDFLLAVKYKCDKHQYKKYGPSVKHVTGHLLGEPAGFNLTHCVELLKKVLPWRLPVVCKAVLDPG